MPNIWYQLVGQRNGFRISNKQRKRVRPASRNERLHLYDEHIDNDDDDDADKRDRFFSPCERDLLVGMNAAQKQSAT